VPAFTEDMATEGEAPAGRREPARAGSAPAKPPPTSGGAGRVVPEAHRPVGASKSAKRQQPQRRTRSKRGRK
jgi:hypothetical protein